MRDARDRRWHSLTDSTEESAQIELVQHATIATDIPRLEGRLQILLPTTFQAALPTLQEIDVRYTEAWCIDDSTTIQPPTSARAPITSTHDVHLRINSASVGVDEAMIQLAVVVHVVSHSPAQPLRPVVVTPTQCIAKMILFCTIAVYHIRVRTGL